MKKLIPILCFFIFSNIISAQNFKGGIIGGISTSQVSGDNLAGYNKAGFFIGVFTEIPISSIINMKMEMNFIQKGSKNPKMNQNTIPDISTSYLEIPLSVNYHQNDLLNFETGLQVAFLLTANDNDIYGSVSSEINNPFNKTDIGAFIGMYYHLTEKISLNSRMSNSIFPIRGYNTELNYLFYKGQYNTVLSFTIHYKI